jgi:endoglucanase
MSCIKKWRRIMKGKIIIFGVLFIVVAGTLSFSYDYGDALEKAIWFFDANKCGPDAGSNNVFSSWRGACHTSDSDGSIDLTGGFHDAGDHVKFGLPQFWTASVMGWALYEYRDIFDNAGVTTKMLSTMKYFTDFILKCHSDRNTLYYEVGEGNADHGYWGPPENQTGSRPVKKANLSSTGSDVCGLATAALVLMYFNYQSTDSSYASRCLTAAEEIYNIGITNVGRCDEGSFYPSSSHYDDLAWGAIWLHIAGGSSSLLDDVEYWMDTTQNDYGDDNYAKEWAPAWDDCTLFVLLKMAQLTAINKFRYGVIGNLTWYRDECTRTPYGLPWLDSWGVLRYASAEAGLGYLAYKLIGWDGYLETADLSMDYTLGSNPRNGSYVTNYLTNPPRHPHHRANEPNRDGNTKGMIGALVGGPDSSDGYKDDVNDYTMNEVAIDYNASFILGLAGIAWRKAGGTPDPTPTLDPSITPTPTPGGADGDIKVQYRCAETNESATQIKPYINIVNQSYDAVDLSELTLRYYYTRDGVDEEEFHIDYAVIGSGNITGTLYEEYAEIGFTSGAGQLAGNSQTGEIQVRINKINWKTYDQSDDYSFDPAFTSFTNYTKITLYRNGTLIYGNEPGFEGTPAPTDPPSDTPTPTPVTGTAPPGGTSGDVNDDGSINIVDALLTAQFYVGLEPANFNPDVADVNCSGAIDIVDALLIAQYYVGLIEEFPC